ncbi:LuxR C-terminal-related transcriptional regulator [Zavarzinia aquatilis]|uniref:HTH luxR-type domain-containing protein n=1 Tax=Zavarzinia aquatilis TaxID=2211142 RepID=A0A317EEF5_9PROT|nr:LuxR C-terminal-related transcriptional regulator [Zavarzinia aquatilis]PWR25299.1 hypothetical protein DKG74_05930 [Zavarzinia aquatilis]
MARKEQIQNRNMGEGRHEPPVFMFTPVDLAALGSLASPAGLSHKAVAFAAPAGFGKTLQMARIHETLRQAGHDCRWLSLREQEQSVDALLSALVSLITPGGAPRHPTEALFSGEPLDKQIERCLAPLAQAGRPVTIFIDNLNFCYDPGLPRLLNRLLFDTDRAVRLVLGSILPLPLDRTRARLEGHLLEIGPADLSFSRAEVTAVLGDRLCEQIERDGIAKVVTLTEGWPAAVRLFHIMLERAAVPREALAAIAGPDENIASLLNDRVLSSFDDASRLFIVGLGQFDRFCLELCRDVGGGVVADKVLGQLITGNILIAPLDPDRRWYRFHGLFRDHLRQEGLRLIPPDARRALHCRAAVWFGGQGLWQEAIEHGLAAHDLDFAENLLESLAARFVRNKGDVLNFIRWMETLQEWGRGATPEASYWYTWALALCRRYDDARRHADRMAGSTGNTAPDLDQRLTMLRVSLDSIADRMAEASDGARRWIDRRAGPSDPFDGTAAHCIVAYHLTASFAFADARRILVAAREAACQSGSAYVQGWAAAYSALVTICEGRLDIGHHELGAALGRARAGLGEDGGITGTLALMQAKCALELGRDDEARRLLDYGLPTARTHGFLESAACGLEAAVKLAPADGGDSALSLANLRDVTTAYPSRLSDMLSCFVVRRLLERDDVEAATAEAQRSGLVGKARVTGVMATVWSRLPLMRDLIRITETELMIGAGRLKQALPRLDADLRQSRLEGRAARAVELALLRGIVASRLDQRDQMLRSLTLALRLATPARLLRPFLVRAEALVRCFEAVGLGEWAFPSPDERGFFLQVCRALPSAPKGLHDLSAGPTLLAPLTRREMELVTLMASGLSNRQMAERINLSVPTVKWHQNNLYAKLNVGNRQAALASAKALNLLRE